jgi:hypothetical protein
MIAEMAVVALTIMAEGENQPWAGKVMIGETIVNQSKIHKKSLAQTCMIPKLFSCWNGKRAKKLEAKLASWNCMTNNQDWKDSLWIARQVCDPGYKVTSPAQFYYNPNLCNPKWAKSMRIVASVGNHLFLAENDGVNATTKGNKQ